MVPHFSVSCILSKPYKMCINHYHVERWTINYGKNRRTVLDVLGGTLVTHCHLTRLNSLNASIGDYPSSTRLFDSQLTRAGPPAVMTKDGIIMIYNGKNHHFPRNSTLPPEIYARGSEFYVIPQIHAKC